MIKHEIVNGVATALYAPAPAPRPPAPCGGSGVIFAGALPSAVPGVTGKAG